MIAPHSRLGVPHCATPSDRKSAAFENSLGTRMRQQSMILGREPERAKSAGSMLWNSSQGKVMRITSDSCKQDLRLGEMNTESGSAARARDAASGSKAVTDTPAHANSCETSIPTDSSIT